MCTTVETVVLFSHFHKREITHKVNNTTTPGEINSSINRRELMVDDGGWYGRV